MRKAVIGILLLVVVICSSTYAAPTVDVDLTSLSFDELLAFRDQIMDEIIARDEWDNVLIPAGAYEIGVDIPKGTWTITAEPYSDPYVNIGNGINDTLTDFADGCIEWAHLTGVYNSHYDSSDRESVTWNFSEGQYFISDGPTIWTKAVRPAFSFNGD